MLKIVVASRNRGKIKEITSILKDVDIKSGVEISSLLCYPDVPEIVEDGSTFSENAVKKALEAARYTGHIAVADDSGLEVDALNGAPGVYSARFAGEGSTDIKNIKKLISLLHSVPERKRTARFVCVMALAIPSGDMHIVEGECRGLIATERRGESGFGYDPIFIVPEYGKTFAELGPEIKNRISHRAIALRKLCSLLEKIADRWI